MQDRAPIAGTQLALGISLAPGATFESYFRGPNGLAVELLQAMARGDGERHAFLAAAPGLGKSHLLQATCRLAADTGRVAYLPLDGALAGRPEVLEGLESLGLVCIDSLEAVAGHADWEHGLFALVNEARSTGTRLLFAARRVPGDLGLALPDLVSRLAWGPVVQLGALDDDAKRGALAARAQTLGLELPAAVADYLVRHYPRDLAGQLERLAQLDRASLAHGRRLTVPFVKEILDDPPHHRSP